MMKSALSALAFVAASASQSSAFTVGTLLPQYICGPPTDGLPKSLGGVIPYFVENTNPQTKVVNGKAPNRPLDMGLGGSLNNTKLLLAGFHNSLNGFVPGTHVVFADILDNNDPKYRTPNFVPTNGNVYPGRDHTITITATLNDNIATLDAVNTALDGAVVYVQNSNGQRVGNFVNTGATAQVWNACGPYSAGVVHNQLLSCTGQYQYVWHAPADLTPGLPITIKGAAVTDNNFGGHTTTYLVDALPAIAVGPSVPPSITKVLVQGGKTASIFFVDPNRGSSQVPSVSFTIFYMLTSTANAGTLLGSQGATIPTGTPAALAAVSTTVSFTTASPFNIDIPTVLSKYGVSGGFLSVNMTATNAGNIGGTVVGGTSFSSNIVSFAIGTASSTPTAISVLQANNYNAPQMNPPTNVNPAVVSTFNSLCDITSYNSAQTYPFPQNAWDPDNSCTTMMTMTLTAVKTSTLGEASVNVVSLFSVTLLGLIAKVFMRSL